MPSSFLAPEMLIAFGAVGKGMAAGSWPFSRDQQHCNRDKAGIPEHQHACAGVFMIALAWSGIRLMVCKEHDLLICVVPGIN